jgi:haloalkane dehalogenase
MTVASPSPVLPDWLRLLYPFRLGSMVVGTERLSYVDEGSHDSPPLLLVHGNPTWSFLWRQIIPSASKRFRVIAPDNIGFGLSSKPEYPGYHTLDRHIDNLTALVEGLGLKGLTLVGNGWGGPIALGYATRHPENISRILLINSWVAPFGAVKTPWQLRLAGSRIGPALVLEANAMISPGIRMLTRRAVSADVLRAYKYPFAKSSDRIGILAFCRMRARVPGDDGFETLDGMATKLSSLSARVEILWGEQDPFLLGKPLPYLLRDSFRNVADPKLLHDAGHLVPEDAPSAVTEKILEVFKPKPQAAVFNILR